MTITISNYALLASIRPEGPFQRKGDTVYLRFDEVQVRQLKDQRLAVELFWNSTRLITQEVPNCDLATGAIAVLRWPGARVQIDVSTDQLDAIRRVPAPPYDYLEPEWGKHKRVHNWRNYISEEIQAAWPTLTPDLRAALARQANEHAEREDWD